MIYAINIRTDSITMQPCSLTSTIVAMSWLEISICQDFRSSLGTAHYLSVGEGGGGGLKSRRGGGHMNFHVASRRRWSTLN